MSGVRKPYNKSVLTIDEQLKTLFARGLQIPDPRRVQHYLRYIGYYRFSGYFPTFLAHDQYRFQDDVKFDSILDLYVFDRKLRLLVMDAVERIEVAVRSLFSNFMCEKYGAHWYLKRQLFKADFKHHVFIGKVEYETGYRNHKKRDYYCRRYFETYSNPYLPPSWVIAEALSIGTWSHLFSKLRSRKDRKNLGDQLGLHFKVLTSWLHSLTYLRNLCAHHSRLWNRTFTVKPMVAKKFKEQLRNNASFSAQASVLNLFLVVIADGTRWQNRLFNLLEENQNISIKEMGFSDKWYEDPFWRII